MSRDAAQDRQLFRHRVMDTLAHNHLVNRCWMDVFEDMSRVDTTVTTLVYSDEHHGLVLNGNAMSGVYQSVPVYLEDAYQIRYVMGMYDADLPEGTSLKFEVSTNGRDFYLVPETGDPKALPHYGRTLIVRVTLTRTSVSQVPVLRGVAVLFEDFNTGHMSIGGGAVVIPPSNYDGPGLKDGPSGAGSEAVKVLDGILNGTRPLFAISHAHLTDVHPDQHHPKNHRHGQDGVDKVNLMTDTYNPPIRLGSYSFTRDSLGRLQFITGPEGQSEVIRDDSGIVTGFITTLTDGTRVKTTFVRDEGLRVVGLEVTKLED